MAEKTETLDLTPEAMAKRLFPGREVVILDIAKRISNKNRFAVGGWMVEFRELKNENQGSG